MQRSSIIEMIHSGRMPESIEMSDLSQLAEKHPYCSTFKVLEAIGAKESDQLELKEYINRAAVYVQDRSKLYEVVSQKGLLSKIKAEKSDFKKEEIESESEPTPSTHALTDKGLISEDALEEQIMAAAVMQLGELEVKDYVDKPQETVDTEEAKEPDSNEPSSGIAETLSEFLLNLEGKNDKPDRAVIDKFISEDRKITPVKKAFFSPTQMGKMSLVEDESFVTETLAKIYERQGDFKKAAKAYENLGLKYPEKRLYFAALQKRAEGNI